MEESDELSNVDLWLDRSDMQVYVRESITMLKIGGVSGKQCIIGKPIILI